MSTKILFAAAALALVFGTDGVGQLAHAQERPNEVVPIRRALEVTDFQPRSGPVGTEVTIYGRGFRPGLTLLVGKRQVQPIEIGPESIRFQIPKGAGNGRIALRNRRGNEVEVGQFAVVVPLIVDGVEPASGLPGTRIAILGRGFRPGDQVFMNGRALAIEERKGKRLSVRIPGDARSDYLTVTRPDGTSARTAQRFKVLKPQPVVTALAPTGGYPGTKVRISGRYFGSNATVFYGKRALDIVWRGPGAGGTDAIDVVIPAEVGRGRYLVVTNKHGEARSPAPFGLIAPPSISRIAPSAGPPGTRVEIFGQSLGGGDVQVLIKGIKAEVLRVRPNRIAVRIPPGAQSGRLVVKHGPMKTRSPERFEVLYAPEIFSIAPNTGLPGTEVTLSGSYFGAQAAVYYGSQLVPVTRRQGDGTLVAKVPPRANRDQWFSVRTPAGTARAPEQFRVQIVPALQRMTPPAGYPGTRVVLTGRNLNRADAVLLGQRPLIIRRKRANRIEAEIPTGARSGPIALQSYGQVRSTNYQFDVLAAPTISSISPPAGLPGTEVTITGGPFTAATQVRLGAIPIPVLRRSGPERLVVQIPINVRGARYLTVQDGLRRARSPERFQVLDPPRLRSFSPRTVRPGLELELRGKGLAPEVQVYIGKRPAVIMRNTSRGLVVQVPPDIKPGPRPVRVVLGGYESTAPGKVLIEAEPELIRFLPQRAESGAIVTLEGLRFGRNTRVYWGQQELYVERRGRGGKRIEVRLPADAVGTDYLFIDDKQTRIRSRTPLEVVAPGPKGIIRDHRRNPR